MKKVFNILFLIVFIAYQAVVIAFTHPHIVGSEIVVHYHPYDFDQEGGHSHTAQEFSLIKKLFPTIQLLVAALFILLFFRILIKNFILPYLGKSSVSLVNNLRSRGPPYYSI